MHKGPIVMAKGILAVQQLIGEPIGQVCIIYMHIFMKTAGYFEGH